MTDNSRRDLEARLRARLRRPTEPPLDATRRFLMMYCADKESMEEVEALVRDVGKQNNVTLVKGLRGIEDLLANPPAEPNAILHIVVWEAGWALNDESEEGAKAWLRQLGDMLRQVLADPEVSSSGSSS